MKNLWIIAILFCFNYQTQAQSGVIKGRVTNSINKQPIPYINVILEGTTTGARTDIDGNYQLTNLIPGIYNISASGVGFKSLTLFEVQVSNINATFLNFELEESAQNLKEVDITTNPFTKREESPVSLRNIGVAEIKRNPGGNRDISKVIQSLPGVAITSSFRNDIIVRGGSPNENRFYLDGIEVPTINHFSTQGSSGGPVGLINVDFIQDVNFYSGAFPANRGNALSSVLDFKYKDARTDKAAYSATIGATDLALSVETPLSKKSTLIASWRRSYLQLLAKALEFPFLPKYDDLQFKTEIKPNSKNVISIIGLGAIDKFTLNPKINKTEENQYDLATLPSSNQWNYTVGGNWRHFKENSYTTFVISRNYLNNEALKYKNNNESDPSNKLLEYASSESENKIRIEETVRKNGWKINYGAGAEYANYNTTTFQKLSNGITFNYASDLNLIKYGAFGQLSKGILKERLQLSLGLRTDGSDFNTEMSNPFNQLSPRLSASYSVTEKIKLNFNTGIYNQLPSYTILGFRNETGDLLNKEVSFTVVQHIVFGIEYATRKNLNITIEGFYKGYDNYPFDLIDSISLANVGGDFGVVGNTRVKSNNKGRAYGFEIFAQQKLFKNFYGLASYTFVRSEFQDINGKYIASSWDYRHMLSLTAGKIFKRNWEAGIKFRYNSGSPYTPYNVAASSLKSNYDVLNEGINDNTLVNSQRIDQFYQIDIRVDKKYNYKKWMLDVYLDIQNITNKKTTLRPNFSIEKDANGNGISDPVNNAYYIPRYIDNISGTLLPSIGVIIQF
ncbi:TonB-dependent receptor [soil metagenome]